MKFEKGKIIGCGNNYREKRGNKSGVRLCRPDVRGSKK